MSIENQGVIEETPSSAATGEQIEGNVENTPATETPTETPVSDMEVAAEPKEGDESGEPQKADTTPKHFREGYEALEKDVKEKYKPIAEAVDALGGIEVVNALKPLAELTLNENADAATVISTLKEVLLPQHLESVAWAAIDNPDTQEVILSDPEVLQVISNKFFGGKSIEEVQSLMESLGADDETDPRLSEALGKLTAYERAQKEEEARTQQAAAEQRVNDLQKRFYVDTAEAVVKQFNLTAPEGASPEDKQLFEDTVEDVRFAAQGRFLKDNAGEYMQIQDMYAKGHVTQARVAEARLQNKWQATLIKTAERHSLQLQAMSASRKAQQQAKVAETRPDLTGNVPNTETKKSEQYDLNDPNWLQNFLSEFKADAANVR